MPELFALLSTDPDVLISRAFRAVDPAALAARVNTFLATYVPTADFVAALRSIKVSAGGEGASWAVALLGLETDQAIEREDVAFTAARVAFRLVNDAEPNFAAQVQECIDEITATLEPGETLSLREHILSGAGQQVWLVGVVGEVSPPPPPP